MTIEYTATMQARTRTVWLTDHWGFTVAFAAAHHLWSLSDRQRTNPEPRRAMAMTRMTQK